MYVSSSLHSYRFGQLFRCAQKRIVNIMKVYIERNNMQVELIRLRKQILSLLTLETSKWILSQPTCLRMESHSNIICLFDINHFKLHFNRLFAFVFKYLRSLPHVSRVCRNACVQIVEICTFMNGGNFDVHTFASDAYVATISLLSVTCHHCSVHTFRMESRSNTCLFNKRQFDSNLLLFIPCLTV